MRRSITCTYWDELCILRLHEICINRQLRTDTKRLELHAEKYLDKRKKEDKNEEEIISMPVKKPWDKQREMANSLKLRMCQFCQYLSTSRQDSPISISLNIGRNWSAGYHARHFSWYVKNMNLLAKEDHVGLKMLDMKDINTYSKLRSMRRTTGHAPRDEEQLAQSH